MNSKLLQKGIEIELYGGTEAGNVLPLSSKLKEYLPELSQEPDQRNFEYITKPTQDYKKLYKEIIEPRLKIRKVLKQLGNYTLIPGSTIPLGIKSEFHFSKQNDPYHKFICKEYGTSVITTSLHMNFGIENYTHLFNLISALRLDTPLFLALSASSCFHNNKVTNNMSHRWLTFPKSPLTTPLFTNHEEYIKWTNEQLTKKSIFNVRHHWASIRPNGPNRPYELNRIEVRICDLVTNTKHVLAIIAFIESLIQSYISNENWPRVLKDQNNIKNFTDFLDKQEELVAKYGLKANIWDWRNNRERNISEIINDVYKEICHTAKYLDIFKYLNPLEEILETGNESIKFMEFYKKSRSIPLTIQNFINEFNKMDLESLNMLQIK